MYERAGNKVELFVACGRKKEVTEMRVSQQKVK